MVKKKRAKWVNKDSIRMIGATSDEVLKLDPLSNGNNYEVMKEPEKSDVFMLYDEKEILKHAEKNLQQKRAIIIHTAIFVLGYILAAIIFSTLFEDSYYYSVGDFLWYSIIPHEGIIGISVLLIAWGIGYISHLVAYLTRKTPEKLLKEYNRIKKDMGV